MAELAKLPNIYDVARLAEVSHQTVSRVINDSPSLKAETRERVLTAMKELGYVPNAAARALVTAKSKIIGILITDFGYHGPAGMMHSMEMEALSAGYMAISVSVDPQSLESINRGVEHLRRMGIEGLVVITPQSDSVSVVEKNVTNIPVVYIDSPNQPKSLSASLDNIAGAMKATQHLIDLGHKNILHIAGPEAWFDAAPRIRGYETAMTQAGLTPRIIKGDWNIETGYQIGKTLDLDKDGITAIFAANDNLALGFMHAFRERGIAIPERVSIVGFDDVPEAPYFAPPLTTLKPDLAALGKISMGLILDYLRGESVENSNVVEPELVVRASTAPPFLATT